MCPKPGQSQAKMAARLGSLRSTSTLESGSTTRTLVTRQSLIRLLATTSTVFYRRAMLMPDHCSVREQLAAGPTVDLASGPLPRYFSTPSQVAIACSRVSPGGSTHALGGNSSTNGVLPANAFAGH